MPISASGTTGDVAVRLTAYWNCDDVLLCWRAAVDGKWDQHIPECLGFMIERRRRLPSGQWSAAEVLRNRVGFSEVPPADEAHATRTSAEWPFQRYDWTDHGANNGQTVQYRVSAMRLPAGAKLGAAALEPIADSGWTEAISVAAQTSDGVSAYFNRGFVMSQYVARLARQNGWEPREIKNHIKELEEPLRRFLSGELRLALLRVLDETINDPSLSLYVALYELSDSELIARLQTLRGRAHVVLANGSDKSGDGNATARAALESANVDVHNRILGSKGLGHNKFAVVVRTKGLEPLKVWTGSTNWAATGLCTQANNGILFEDPQVASLYLEQWDRLAAAKNDFPPALVSANAASPREAKKTDVWFTRVRNPSKKTTDIGNDLEALVEAVSGAKKAILYVMFQPGEQPLEAIVQRASDGVYVRGVVSTLSNSIEEKFTLAGISTGSREFHTAVIQPEGIVKDFGSWVKEVTRSQFLFPNQSPGVGHAITHSKMIVVDPFTDDCKVVTGSHNFSKSASESNDENFVIVTGNRALAEAYSVACLSTYAHYRWRAHVKETVEAEKQPWSHLTPEPVWQDRVLNDRERQHVQLWCPVV